MSITRILGLVAIVVGVILLVFALNSTQTVTEKIVEGVTGRYTNYTMWYIIGGIVLIVGGGAFALRNCCNKRKEK